MSKIEKCGLTAKKQALYQLHCHIKGRVQGVGFRYFVMNEAENRSLSGWVRNTDSGEVEVVLSGAKPFIESMLSALQQGPPLARILRVEFDWEEPDPALKGFEIRQ